MFFHPPAKRVSATKCDKESGRIVAVLPIRPTIFVPSSVRHLPLLSDHDLTLSFDSRCAHTAKPEITRLRPFGREVGRRVGVDADDGGGVGRVSPGDGDGPGRRPSRARRWATTRRGVRRRWSGAAPGPACLDLNGVVTDAAYEAIFGPGGASHPASGVRLAATRRPGMELVIGAHKSLAVLGVIGRAEDMHAVMDAERDATLAYLDDVTRRFGGRRGRAGWRWRRRGWCSPTPAMPRPGRVIPPPTITCWSRTWSRCATSGAGGRRPTRRCGASTSTPPPSPAGSPAPAGRSSWATRSNRTTARRAGWASGASPASPSRRRRCSPSGPPR